MLNSRYLKLPNEETYHYLYKEGGEDTIIFVHGQLASSKFYEQILEDLPSKYSAYAIDMRGFGHSSYNRPIATLRDFARDLKLFIDTLDITQFTLVGWSTGGAVSMLFSSMFSQSVKKLILLGSVIHTGYHSYGLDQKGNKIHLSSKQLLQEDITKQAMINAYQEKNRDYCYTLWNQAIYNCNKPSPDVFDQHITETLRQQHLLDVYYCLTHFNISDNYNGVSMGTSEVHHIKMPVSILIGDSDLLVSVDEARSLKTTIGSNASLHILPHCGHSPMIDAPASIIQAITASD